MKIIWFNFPIIIATICLIIVYGFIGLMGYPLAWIAINGFEVLA